MDHTINLQRVYEASPPFLHTTFLVDRLWPRGIAKAQLAQVIWLKDVAPTAVLRKSFHQNMCWETFVAHYRAELANSDAWQPILDAMRQQDAVTLLFASKDIHHNQAVVLRDFLLELIARE